MTGSVAATRIREHLARVRALGVVRLALFGSAARDEMTEASDLDVISDHLDPVDAATKRLMAQANDVDSQTQ